VAECSFVELAAGAIRAGTVQGHGKKARLIAFHEERLTADEDELPRLLNGVLENLAARVKLAGKSVVFTLSSKFIIFREVDFPFNDRKRVIRTLPFQIEEKLSLPVDEVVIDAFEVSKTETSSKWFACCVTRKLMRAVLEACQNASIDPVAITPSFAGLPAICESRGNVLYVDIGNETTDLSVIVNGDIHYCRSLRLAGKTLSRAIAEALSVDIAIAEQTKHASLGFEDKDQTIRDILTSEFSRLARDIRLTLSTLPQELAPSVIRLVGGGAALKGVDKFLADKLGITVEIVPPETVTFGQTISKPHTSGMLLPCGCAMLTNMGQPAIVNFRRDEFVYHGVFDAIAFPLMVLLLCFCGIFGVFIFHFGKSYQENSKAYADAAETMSSWWTAVMPADALMPRDVTKFSAFIDDRMKKLDENRELKARYYSKSVLNHVKLVRNFLRGVELQFTLESLDANKTSVRIVITVNEEDSPKVNEVITRGRESFEVISQADKRPDGTIRYSLTFTYK
jgi:Tfp pilus assembly PilM family ATPase